MNKLFSAAGLAISATAVLTICTVMSGCMTAPKQQMFPNPEDAVGALITAVSAGDGRALNTILGPDADDILSSGDETADKAGRAKFLDLYNEKHKIGKDADGKAEIVIGREEWPFPIPLIQKNDGWCFDTKAGKEEILDRRIGRNELATIQVLLAVVDAQREYAMKDRDGDGILEYAAKFRSTEGSKDGLYWKAADGEEQSPLGLLAAKAQEEKYEAKEKKEGAQPYHGYIYRIITRQGANASGGAFEYFANDSMIGGFAVIASPAQYGNSGVMTFIVSYEGIVYQKDLGPETADIAGKMDSFDPDVSWQKVK